MTTTYAVGQRLTASLLQSLADYTVNKPIVRLIAVAGQNLTDNTGAAIAFGTGSTIVDTHSLHSESTNNSRVTPTIAGWYKAWGKVVYSAQSTYLSLQSTIRFNGADQIGAQRDGPNATSSPRSGAAGPILLLCNGSTDYIELAGLQDDSGGTTRATLASGSTTSYFEVEFVRPA